MAEEGSEAVPHDVDEMTVARRQLEKKRRKSKRMKDDEYYISCLGLRAVSVEALLADAQQKWPLQITSFNEDKVLRALGVSKAEQHQIEGLQHGQFSNNRRVAIRDDRQQAGLGLTNDQLCSRAIARLAANPPQKVGRFQQRTVDKQVRAYPHGLRFSGSNMNPQPCWLAGIQSVALNMSNVDVALQLHFALFKGSSGFLLKPVEMRTTRTNADLEDGCYWPPFRDTLHRTTIELITLHALPKRGEERPRLDGSRGDCHKYVPDMSGKPRPPDDSEPSSPAVRLVLYPIGGFCAVCKKLPLSSGAETETDTARVKANGLNAVFAAEKVHCFAAEPHATFLRIEVVDGVQEVAYETAVLGRLKHGYRVLQMRGPNGTRIELCYLFVKISFGSTGTVWLPHRHVSRLASLAIERRETEVIRS